MKQILAIITIIKSRLFALIKVFDLKSGLQLIAILVAITFGSFMLFFNKKRIESEQSNISLQMGIQPSENNYGIKGGYYDSWYMFINTGQATIRTANIFWFLNNQYIKYSSQPYLVGGDHGAEINILETTTPGFCELNIKDLPPGVGFTVYVRHIIKDNYRELIYQNWSKDMFSKNFTSFFLSEISTTGEKISIVNDGIYDLEKLSRK